MSAVLTVKYFMQLHGDNVEEVGSKLDRPTDATPAEPIPGAEE